MLLVYLFTGQLELTAGVGIGDVVFKLMFYFLHERAWNRITFGRTLSVMVKSAMRAPPILVQPLEDVSSVVHKMLEFDIGSIIVTVDENQFGLITERDILERVVNVNKFPDKTLAKEIMSSPLETIEYKESLTEALKIIARARVLSL